MTRRLAQSTAYTVVRRLFSYDPETGLLTWQVRHGKRVRVGDVAGCIKVARYPVVGFGGTVYLSHRVMWLWMTGEWPMREIDHIDGNPANNCWDNLRLATRSQNLANTRRRRDNTSGYKGVCWHAPAQKWHARIHFNKRQISLGYFDNPAEAHAVYKQKASELCGEFARAA